MGQNHPHAALQPAGEAAHQNLPWRTQYPDLAAFTDRLAQRQSFKDSVPEAQTIADKVV